MININKEKVKDILAVIIFGLMLLSLFDIHHAPTFLFITLYLVSPAAIAAFGIWSLDRLFG